MDATNLHLYPGGRNPETAGWGDTVRGLHYGSLAYRLEGDLAGMQACLLQKQDGAFYLAVWAGSQTLGP